MKAKTEIREGGSSGLIPEDKRMADNPDKSSRLMTPSIPIGTKTKFGEVLAVGYWRDERKYWLKIAGEVVIKPASEVEGTNGNGSNWMPLPKTPND